MPGYKWISCGAGAPLPPGAVLGGRDVDGTPIYVGRADHYGDVIPAKVIHDKNVAYVSHNGVEHMKHVYEILCETRFTWEPASGGDIPANAVVAGHTAEGDVLYVGRVHHHDSLTIGKVHQNHGCLYIPFNGTELSFPNYEVLVDH